MLEPLVEFLVLPLLKLRFTLDRLFVDLKLRDLGVKGARMVDRVEFRAARDALEETPNPNIGYTGSTGAGELLGFASGVPVREGFDGSRGPSINSGLGKVLRRVFIDPPRRPFSLRRSRRTKRMPRTRMMRIITDEETEMAMTAGLMKTSQFGQTCYRKRFADLDNPWDPLSAAEVGCGESGERHPLGLFSSPCTESKSDTRRFPTPSLKSNATSIPWATFMMNVNISIPSLSWYAAHFLSLND